MSINKYTKYDTNNVFAKIIRGEIPCNKVYEDNETLAFHDINPEASIHVLVIPKRCEYTSFDSFMQEAEPEYVANFFKTVQKIAAKLKLQENGYRITTNHKDDALQTIHHFHVHILGGQKLGKMCN